MLQASLKCELVIEGVEARLAVVLGWDIFLDQSCRRWKNLQVLREVTGWRQGSLLPTCVWYAWGGGGGGGGGGVR